MKKNLFELMKRGRPHWATLIMVSLAAGMLGPTVAFAGDDPSPVTFYAMGCGPYEGDKDPKINKDPKKRLTTAIKTLNDAEKPAAFLIHLGDIFGGNNKNATEKDYKQLATMFTKPNNRIPTFFLPGDNEWIDQNNAWGWYQWSRFFLLFNETPGQEYLGKVTRQPKRPENFAFTKGRVLFIGINKVGIKKKDWKEETKRHDCLRMKEVWADAAKWIKDSYQQYMGQFDAAVVMAQAAPFGLGNKISKSLEDVWKKHGNIPLLYIHADAHMYCWQERDWGFQLMVDQIDGSSEDKNRSLDDIIRVTVNPAAKDQKEVFQIRNMVGEIPISSQDCKEKKGFQKGRAPERCAR